jgi:hypothetical protein
VKGYVKVEDEYATYASHTSSDEDVRLTPYKTSALDPSRGGSQEDVDGYSRDESTLAA